MRTGTRIRTIPGTRAFARLAPWGGWLLAAALLVGCAEKRPPTVQMRNPWLSGMRVAVAPALNFSGTANFDPNMVADLMASELSYVDGFDVMPVSRTLAVLLRQGAAGVESPEHALEICEALGADAILVFAVTEYNPYEPPVVGITAQLYGSHAGAGPAGFDPVRVTRYAAPVEQRGVASALEPLAQVSRVRNAAHEPVIREVLAYARSRGADNSPYGWRKYLAVQKSYLRFCCHATIKELVQCGVNRRLTVEPPAAG